MTVRLDDNSIRLIDQCGVEEVDVLVGYLEGHADLPVDISAATAIHTSLWQTLMVFRRNIVGAPMSSLMADKVLSALQATFAPDTQDGERQN